MTTSRNATIDVARGFTAFIMPAVHSLLYYGNAKARQSWLGKIMGHLAEGPGAQLFMFLMGVSITLGKKKSKTHVLKRACLLMVQSFLLNYLRLVIPYKLKLLPEQLWEEAGIARNNKPIGKMLLLGDILPCAAISYLITGLLYQKRGSVRSSMLLALAMALGSPKVWDKHSNVPLIDYLLRVCTWRPPETFFPVFPWLTYALAGVAWGHYRQNIPEKKLYAYSSTAGLLLLVSGKIISHYEPARLKETFYRLGPGGTFEHLGIVLLWLCLCHEAVKRVKWNPFFNLLMKLSRHITPIYFIQWIIVLWLLPLFGYRKSGMFRSLVSMIMNTLLTIQVHKIKKNFLWKQSLTLLASA